MKVQIILDDSGVKVAQESSLLPQSPAPQEHPTGHRDTKWPRRMQTAFLITVSAAAWAVIILAGLPFLWR